VNSTTLTATAATMAPARTPAPKTPPDAVTAVTWIYLGAVTFVAGAEINVVRERRLWPRSLLTPFTDNVELTAGDRRAYASYAATERHKGFENVDVDFDPPADDAD
jgi:hypothetical protein